MSRDSTLDACIRAALDSSDTEDPASRSGSLVAPLPAHRRGEWAEPGIDYLDALDFQVYYFVIHIIIVLFRFDLIPR